MYLRYDPTTKTGNRLLKLLLVDLFQCRHRRPAIVIHDRRTGGEGDSAGHQTGTIWLMRLICCYSWLTWSKEIKLYMNEHRANGELRGFGVRSRLYESHLEGHGLVADRCTTDGRRVVTRWMLLPNATR